MTDSSAHRFLELLCRRLGAEDARIEIGGQPPTEPNVLWTPLGQRRLVVVFAHPLEETALGELRKRLNALAEAFAEAATSSSEPQPLSCSTLLVQEMLDQALADLAERCQAEQAIVIDATSPVAWGCAYRTPSLRLDSILVRRATLWHQAWQAVDSRGEHGPTSAPPTAPLCWDEIAKALTYGTSDEPINSLPADPAGRRCVLERALRTYAAVGAVRRHVEDASVPASVLRREVQYERFGYLARSLVDIYILVLVFSGRFSSLLARRELMRSIAYFERLVLALPPFEPPPKRARVIRFEG